MEGFLRLKLPQFQVQKVAPRIADLLDIVRVGAPTTDWPGTLPNPVLKAFIDAFPMLLDAAEELNWQVDNCAYNKILPITTKLVFSSLRCHGDGLTGPRFSFMDVLWQYNNPPNPSDAAIGPQAYDHHLYYRLVRILPFLHCLCL